jgi:A/G-specific adenine glycosylase
VARRTGRIAELPAPRARKPLPLKNTTWFVYRSAGKVLLERRPSPGIWGGLWCFPEQAVLRGKPKLLPVIEHGFTHFRLRIQPLLHDVKAESGGMWIDLDDALRAAVPTPVKNLLQDLQRNATRRGRNPR